MKKINIPRTSGEWKKFAQSNKKIIIYFIIGIIVCIDLFGIFRNSVVVGYAENYFQSKFNKQTENTDKKIAEVKEEAQQELEKANQEYERKLSAIRTEFNGKLKIIERKRVEEFNNADTPQKKISLASDLIKSYRDSSPDSVK